jgi:hypothetical protein
MTYEKRTGKTIVQKTHLTPRTHNYPLSIKNCIFAFCIKNIIYLKFNSKMKKLFVAVAILTASVTVSKAQFYVGGGLGFWFDSDWEEFSFNISPEAGYSFNKHWTAGLEVGFDYRNFNSYHHYPLRDNENEYYYHITPYARFNYFSTEKIKLFVDGVLGFSIVGDDYAGDLFGCQVVLRPGIAVDLTKHFSLVGTFGIFGYRMSYLDTEDGFGLSLRNTLQLGLYYSF